MVATSAGGGELLYPGAMTFSEIMLWAYVVALGVLTGGALFEFRVLVHVWSSAPPASVRAWNPDPSAALDPPKRFFVLVTPSLMLLTPANAWSAWGALGPARPWLLASTALTFAVIVVTLAYFAPTLHALTVRRGEGLSDDVIVRRASAWVRWQYLRLAALIAAWLTALAAFRVR